MSGADDLERDVGTTIQLPRMVAWKADASFHFPSLLMQCLDREVDMVVMRTAKEGWVLLDTVRGGWDELRKYVEAKAVEQGGTPWPADVDVRSLVCLEEEGVSLLQLLHAGYNFVAAPYAHEAGAERCCFATQQLSRLSLSPPPPHLAVVPHAGAKRGRAPSSKRLFDQQGFFCTTSIRFGPCDTMQHFRAGDELLRDLEERVEWTSQYVNDVVLGSGATPWLMQILSYTRLDKVTMVSCVFAKPSGEHVTVKVRANALHEYVHLREYVYRQRFPAVLYTCL